MPLLGQAAMLLSFDIAEEAVTEHDDWHTHEHLPERLAIPGFLRGTRWVALQASPRYLVLYEVDQLKTLTSDAYLERLNDPTPWTSRMMPHYRDMTRGLCSVVHSSGLGTGHFGLLIRFSTVSAAQSRTHAWLIGDVLAGLSTRAGIGSAHLLKGAGVAQMTNEQRIRGVDRGVDSALLVTGYGRHELEALAQTELCADAFLEHGACDLATAMYRTDFTLAAGELATCPATPASSKH